MISKVLPQIGNKTEFSLLSNMHKDFSKINHLGLKPLALLDIDFASITRIKTIGVEEGRRLLYGKSWDNYSCLNRSVDMKINGETVKGKLIDGGGTKTAYSININNNEQVILLPNKPERWLGVLSEPENTKIVKNSGLLANDFCEIVPIELEGKTFPALISKPYSKHSFKIFDVKNPNDVLDKYINPDSLNEEKVVELLKDAVADINKITKNNFNFGYDNFNIAYTKDGKIRLFINDIGESTGDLSERKVLTDERKKLCSKRYLRYLINGFQASFISPSKGSYLSEISRPKYLEELENKLSIFIVN